MFQTPVISVAMGLCFTFGSVALIAAALNEAFASLFKLRGRLLLDGLKQLLNRDASLVAAVYTHGIVNPMEPGATLAKAIPAMPAWMKHDGLWGMVRGRLAGGLPFDKVPSYISSPNFAVALIDAIGGAQRHIASIGAAVASIQDAQLRGALQVLLQRAEGNVDRFEKGVADWFDQAMDRLSGSYKRRAQLYTFIFGLIVACALNVDATHVATVLWAQPIMQAPNAGALPGNAQDAVAALSQLPIGWLDGNFSMDGPGALRVKFAGIDFHPSAGFSHLVGWLLTASAAVFGAPFWFDLLQRVVQLRSTGPKPNAGGAPRA